ncbi:MAG: hypothetical protein JSS11_09680 [Verrucomicrobia bacterium]|nr:hypothetical protein [Verrucomicrobiota bacterium]
MQTAVGRSASDNKAEAFESDIIRSGLAKLRIDDGFEIVVSDAPDLVEQTAAEVLQKFLGQAGMTVAIVPEGKAVGAKRFLLGRDSDLKAITRLQDHGELKIREVSAEDDGFHLKRIGPVIVIAGANPRGVLYGVYALKDFIAAGATGGLDIRRVPYFRKRGSGLCYTDAFFNPELLEDFPEEKAAYLSRLGINQFTDQGIGGNLGNFVTSDVFPFQKPPRPDYQRKVRIMSALCKKYGIDFYVYINEPALPRLAGDLAQYPPEALGTVKPPWGGDKDGKDKTLCVSSPMVQRHLRNMMMKFVKEYPDVKGVELYNMDVSAWLCTPGLCPRCQAVCTDSPPDEFNPWETQATLVTLLAEAAHEARRGFDFRFWGAVHYHGDRFEKMIRVAQGYDGLLASWTGSDRTVMIPDAAKPDPSWVISQRVCAERGLPFYMACEFNNLEVVPKSLPFPFHVADALAKYKRWGARNLTENYGMAPEQNPINALVMKEFQWNPDQNPEVYLTDLARRQFGGQAGKKMYLAWQEIRQAFDVWHDQTTGPFPLEGSQFHVKMGVAIGGLPPSILPDIVNYYDSTLTILSRVEPWLSPRYQEHRTPAFLAKMIRMNSHFSRAAGYAEEAVAAASDRDYIGRCDYPGSTGRPTCRAYAELNWAPVAIAENLCTQRCDLLRAYQLLVGMANDTAAGNRESAVEKERLYHALLREDIGVQERFAALLKRFATMEPCYMRTSLTEHEIADLLAGTQAKIKQLQDFLVHPESAGAHR